MEPDGGSGMRRHDAFCRSADERRLFQPMPTSRTVQGSFPSAGPAEVAQCIRNRRIEIHMASGF
jgi:hypothetical protein